MKLPYRVGSKGFTLMELLIVIAIIGILVTVATASYTSAQLKSRNSRRKTDMKAVQNGLEQYYSDMGSVYPSAGCGALTTTYLPAGLPSDPKPAPYPGYAYSCASSSSYCICAQLEGAGDGNATSNACGGYGTSGGQYFCIRQLQ